MSPRVALIIGAATALVFGLILVLAPAQIFAGFGLGTPNEALVVARDNGTTLLGLAVINWLARDATGSPLRAILIGNIVVQVLEIVVNAYEIPAGLVPAQAAGGVVLHLVLGAMFAWALTRAR